MTMSAASQQDVQDGASRSLPLLAYALLAAPIAMSALPVYVLIPKYYEQLGLPLGVLGMVLFAARLVDTVQDPWIGRLVDRLQSRPAGWAALLCGGSGVLAVALTGLFLPPVNGSTSLAIWLALALIVAYTAHSCVNICYLAWGARISDSAGGRARVSAWREAMALLGVLVASAAPVLLAAQYGPAQGYLLFTLAFALVLAVSLWALLRAAPTPQLASDDDANLGWSGLLRDPALRKLYIVYGVNSLAVSVPATLVLFFIDDVIGATGRAGLFLVAYFLSGAFAMPLWVKLADRIGKSNTWLVGMGVGSVAFIWAVLLGQGDWVAYLMVCVLSGLALGADLAMPPAMLADLIPPERRRDTGVYFGMWALIGKLALALAAGVTLPLLAWLGYQPGQGTGHQWLAVVYAALPCTLKFVAATLLMDWQLYWLPRRLRNLKERS
jgi:Na+/melibiose symporter-like transporter